MTIAICWILGAVLLAAATVLTIAAALGKKLEVTPSTKLEGVDESIENALWYSSIAANSHNAQAWIVTLYPAERRLDIRVDDSRTLNVVDPAKREAYLSLGCYLETARVAFDACGYDTGVSYAAKDGSFQASLTYTVRENARTDEGKLALIEKRHTDKSAYSSDRIDQASVDELLAGNPAVKCFQRGEKGFEYLKQGTLNAVSAQSASQATRDELANWLRFSDREATEKLDGITADMLGLKGIVKTFYHWTTTRESAAGDRFAAQGVKTAKKQVEHCGAFFAVTGGNTPIELVGAGRDTQAFWFDCAQMGISLQPMSAMLETRPFCQSLQKDLATPDPVQMILRAGYVKKYGSNCGLRRNLGDYIRVIP